MPNKRVKVDGRIVSVPADATPDEIDEISRQGSQPANTSGHVMSAQPDTFSWPGMKKLFYETADRVTNALPTIGGVVGGAIGGGAGSVEPGGGTVLGAIGGAGIGGMGGEAARRLTRGAIFPGRDAANVSDVANGISREGVSQALYEAGGQGISRGGKMLAPKIAEAAMAPGKRALKSLPEGAAPIGETVLNETKGYSPKSIVKELDTKIGDARSSKVTALRDAGERGTEFPLAAPQDMSKLEVEKATNENAPEYIRGARDVRNQLHFQMGEDGKPLMTKVARGSSEKPTEVALPDFVDPLRYDALRQGVDRTIGSFNPETAGALDPLRKQIRGTMSRELHSKIPEIAPLDQRMTNMIPARDAAWNTSFNPGIESQFIDKLKRPTGALVGGLAGAEEGRRRGGLGGAVVGGTLGLVGGNLIASPEGLMALGRGLHNFSGPVGTTFRAGVPMIASQMKKKPGEDGSEE